MFRTSANDVWNFVQLLGRSRGDLSKKRLVFIVQSHLDFHEHPGGGVKCRDFYEFGERLVFVFSTNSTILPLFSVRFRLKEKKSE